MAQQIKITQTSNADMNIGIPKKMTAVEWLVEQIRSDQNQKALTPTEWMQVIEQVKQMEKEQTGISNQVPFYEICSCNPKNGGSGICGCTISNKMVYGK